MFKKRENVGMSSICDPDTSDDEGIIPQNIKPTKKTQELVNPPKPTRVCILFNLSGGYALNIM